MMIAIYTFGESQMHMHVLFLVRSSAQATAPGQGYTLAFLGEGARSKGPSLIKGSENCPPEKRGPRPR